MRSITAVLAVGSTLALLSGCAADTSTAEAACYNYIVDKAQSDGTIDGWSNDQQIEYLVFVREDCAANAAKDPTDFIELWLD